MALSGPARPPAGPLVDEDGVTFRMADSAQTLAGVRLWQEVHVPGDQLDFVFGDGVWTLRLERPGVHRMEYLFELQHADGGRETVLDPGNPLRVGGAFGEHSVVEFPDYARPTWLDATVSDGEVRHGATRSSSLAGQVGWVLWSASGLADDAPAPLLLVHDGPEFAELSQLLTYAAAMVGSGRLPPLRLALLEPGPRDERYSANAAYVRAVARVVLPAIRAQVAVSSVVGMGASLGALSMLVLHRRHPAAVDGLFLQSGSFFHQRLDAQERGYARFARIERFVSSTLRAEDPPRAIPVTMTCGAIEENVENNRLMARALRAQGYEVTFVEVPDVHNYTGWRDAFDPHLTNLVAAVVAATPADKS
jgi:enterochelin esterase-like enzyme